jgi:hypothetical protein
MSRPTFALSIVTLLALTLTAHAGGGSAGTGGTAAAPSTTGGTAQMSPGATGGTTEVPATTGGITDVPATTTGGTAVAPVTTTGGTAQVPGIRGNPAASQQTVQPLRQIQADQRRAVTTGSNTRPSEPNIGVVSAPGVGVGHAANGLPIGSPGSGLGSPEQSQGPTTRH